MMLAYTKEGYRNSVRGKWENFEEGKANRKL